MAIELNGPKKHYVAGMLRYQIINELLKLCTGTDPAYLEIGVDEGECYGKVEAARKTCVDPNPKRDLPGLFRMGSNKFFEGLADEKFDVVFIDGLHTYEQSLQDLLNAAKRLETGGFIVMHDCNPPDESHAGEFSGGNWNGDVWKTVMYAIAAAEGYEIFTVDVDWGCAVLCKRHAWAVILEDQKTFEAMRGAPYAALEKDRKGVLNLITEAEFAGWLSKQKGR